MTRGIKKSGVWLLIVAAVSLLLVTNPGFCDDLSGILLDDGYLDVRHHRTHKAPLAPVEEADGDAPELRAPVLPRLALLEGGDSARLVIYDGVGAHLEVADPAHFVRQYITPL